eukprot:PhF_6_TR36142/c0_g1_i4/m.52514/K15027/EIF2D; translation initiation factor 2D
MFTKPLGKVKSSAMSERDVKGLRARFSSSFPSAKTDDLFPKGTSLTLNQADAKGCAYTFYSVTKTGVPLCYHEGGANSLSPIVPTVFACAMMPTLLQQVIVVHDDVSERIKDGAHVMAPGIIRRLSTLRLTVGGLCVVVCVPSCLAIAVGVIEQPITCASGKTVTVLHTMWDNLVVASVPPSCDCVQLAQFKLQVNEASPSPPEPEHESTADNEDSAEPSACTNPVGGDTASTEVASTNETPTDPATHPEGEATAPPPTIPPAAYLVEALTRIK